MAALFNVSPAATRITVAGDVCFDVVTLAAPPEPLNPGAPVDNWRLTGETHTHFLAGGALLMEDLVRASGAGVVAGPRFTWPAGLVAPAGTPSLITAAQLLPLAQQLTRDEIVHSLLSLDAFAEEPNSKKRRIRVQHTHGFSGPTQPDPSLTVHPPQSSDAAADIVVLDDTGNQFRRTASQWPVEVSRASTRPLIVHKLHRPLPLGVTGGNPLWDTVRLVHADRHIVVVSIDDLRAANAPISCGLSWERTALDLVWQLLNVDTFSALRDCGSLIVRLGIDGAVYWTSDVSRNAYHAWLIYDPAAIEGAGEQACPGRMVGYGNAFVAGIVKSVTEAGLTFDAITKGVATGLAVSRRLLRIGFGSADDAAPVAPAYPGAELFDANPGAGFACQAVPIIRGSAEPDRGYWRLLDSVFADQTAHLHRAVALTATGAKPSSVDEKAAAALLKQAPIAIFNKALRTYDRREMEHYRALYSLMRDYVSLPQASRPLNVAVFGPPGAGKSFGVKMVAKELASRSALRPIETLTFNLSQYQSAEDVAAAFHLVRDAVLHGRVPLVFFDEFDTALNGTALGWLRYFLSPMQDAEFVDRGTPHPIGQAIFVFAGGTCASYAEFARPFLLRDREPAKFKRFKDAKGPDFLSRLRATLDIPGLDLNSPFDAYGPVDAFPCEAAILLRRASILAFQLGDKAPHLRDGGNGLRVGEPVLRALLHLPQFTHGNRSFEALLDMSHLQDARSFVSASLPAAGHTSLHANAAHLSQLLATTYPFSESDRLAIAQEVHKDFVEERKNANEYDPVGKPSHRDWLRLSSEDKESNLRQADDIPRKIRMMNRWFRKAIAPFTPGPLFANPAEVEPYAMLEHDRWVADKRHGGYTYGPPPRDPVLRTHHCVVPWDDPRLSEQEKQKDRAAIQAIPRYLAAAGFEVIDAN